MFKKLFNKLKSTVSRVENRDLMEAIVAAAVLVAYADGDCSSQELEKLDGIIKSNDNLAHFGGELGKTIDKYADMYEASARMAKMKLMKEIRDVSSDEYQKAEAFVIAIEIADADGSIDDAELKILKEIGKALGLNVEDFL